MPEEGRVAQGNKLDAPALRKRYIAVVIGSLTRDRIDTDQQSLVRVGGVVWYAGVTLTELGIETRAVTRVAATDHELTSALRGAGADVLGRRSAKTTTFVNKYTSSNPDARTQEIEAIADPIEATDVIQPLAGADLVYLGPVHPKDIADDVFTVIGSRDELTVALDVQGYTRVVDGREIKAELYPHLPEIIRGCDVIKASHDEASIITGSSNPRKAALLLGESFPGARGPRYPRVTRSIRGSPRPHSL